MNHSLSILIPNYNGKHLLQANLPSVLAAAENSNFPFEIIVADDASTDDSVVFLKENHPAIKIIEHQQNAGFSKNTNSAIFAAQHNLVLILNSDIQLSADYFKNQLHYFENENCFGVMGCIKDADSKKIIDAAKYPTVKGFEVRATTNYFPLAKTDLPIPSLFLSGANALVRRDYLMQLHGFNEIFSPFYHEDLELGIRAWRMGWLCFYEPSAICFHQTSATIQIHFKKQVVKIIADRNKFVLHEIHLQGLQKLGWQLKNYFNFIFRIFVLDFIWYKSFFSFLKMKTKINLAKTEWQQQLQGSRNQNSLQQIIAEMKKQIETLGVIEKF